MGENLETQRLVVLGTLSLRGLFFASCSNYFVSMYTHNGVMGSNCPFEELAQGFSPDTCVHRPFIGDIKGLFHNCSGLFCTDIPKRNIKLKRLDSQLMSFDFVSLGEAHIDAEKCAVFNASTSHTPSYNFWLPGTTGGDGGLGILISHRFGN